MSVNQEPRSGVVEFRPRARLLKLIGSELISDDVLAVTRGRARQLPAATTESADWIRGGQQRWMRPESVRR